MSRRQGGGGRRGRQRLQLQRSVSVARTHHCLLLLLLLPVARAASASCATTREAAGSWGRLTVCEISDLTASERDVNWGMQARVERISFGQSFFPICIQVGIDHN